jgi:hypothetical protein
MRISFNVKIYGAQFEKGWSNDIISLLREVVPGQKKKFGHPWFSHYQNHITFSIKYNK